MARFNVGHFAQRFRALLYKNFLITVVRRPFSFFFWIYAIPIAIVAVLLNIPNFQTSSDAYGVGTPSPIKALADIVDEPLVVVRSPHLNEEVDKVIETFTEGIADDLLIFEESVGAVSSRCVANLRGASPCFGAITFIDSPETTKLPPESLRPDYFYSDRSENNWNHTWSYRLQLDNSKTTGRFDVPNNDNKQEKWLLPFQLAVNQAITNITTTPKAFGYTTESQEQYDRDRQEQSVSLIADIYVFALFAGYLFIIYRHVSFITEERETGMAQLVDAMGGGSAATARVLSWLITYNIYCLPVFIIFGVLFWNIMFPSADAGLLIGWQILLGLSVNGAIVFASAFFRKSRVSAVYVIGGFLLLAVGAQIFALGTGGKLPDPDGAYILSLLFPSSNFVFFVLQMCVWELNGKNPDPSTQPAPSQYGPQVQSYNITLGELLGFLVVQIILYPILAILVERKLHGIDFRNREFLSEGTNTSGVVAETTDLVKAFQPTFLEKIFCCGKRRTVKAVNGVSLQGRAGQILCLVGPNGSGKTTTLHMMSGFIKPSSGSVKMEAKPSQIGICPQRNTHWEDLTVDEHLRIWSQIKASKETPDDLAQLLESCDLTLKRGSKSKTLSGGQKRKLQLACMFVGDSNVCLIDECTSGLDPLSRRVIWEILLEQRAKRSIVFTTHFLDEVDVLADNIVILTEGRVNCSGAAAELKNAHGGGYRVSVPCTDSGTTEAEYPSVVHQDRLVYTTPDSRTAATLASKFNSSGILDIGVTGPSFEDVFLSVADDGSIAHIKEPKHSSYGDFELEAARVTSFWSQVHTLFLKRIIILKRFWIPYLLVLALPLVITPFLHRLVEDYELPTCENLEPVSYFSEPYPSWTTETYCEDPNDTFCPSLVIAPPSANKTLFELVKEGDFPDLSQAMPRQYYKLADVADDFDEFKRALSKMTYEKRGGVFMGSSDQAPVIGFSIVGAGSSYALDTLNLWSEMESGIPIEADISSMAEGNATPMTEGTSYAVFFTLVHAIWPAASVLYPAIEKARKVRSLEYANGVRRSPMWLAYGLFDTMFALALAIGCSLIMFSEDLPWNGSILIMLPILFLYGVAAILQAYLVAHFVTGPLKSFLATVGLNILMYAIAAVAFSVGSGYSNADSFDQVTNGITFGLNLILPIGNVLRALFVGVNTMQVGCKDGNFIPSASIYSYGGPILYLCIQVAVLLLLIIWVEGDLALFRSKGSKAAAGVAWRNSGEEGDEKTENIIVEEKRVKETEGDFLRMLSVDKSFGSNHAVQDVTLGLPPNDVMALLGPNGAGKSTLVNMIQSELTPDHGKILLREEDARTRSAQRYLGVCPQHDALDVMNTREHLTFYARIKGVSDIKGNVDHIMARLSLTPHASTLATKLSGGNKRKLSLAIAMMGAPPVMVLDEPTSAMDAVAKRAFWRLIQDVAPGRSVLLTTHSMEEADALATRAAIFSKRLLAVGTTEALREKYSNVYYVSLLLKSAPNSSEEEMNSIRSWLQGHIPGAQLERTMLGGQIRFTIPGDNGTMGRSSVVSVIELLEREKYNLGIEYYSVGGATLERVFLNVARENNTKEEDGVANRGFLSRWRAKKRSA